MDKGLEFSFAWLFAIIVGIFILFLAIYFSAGLINIGEKQVDARVGKDFGVLLNPLETSFQSEQSDTMTVPAESRIYLDCDLQESFGRQLIKVSQKSFNKWTDTNVNVPFQNKYIFSEEYAEGKKFYLFSKPFEFPYKVADVIILTSSKKSYCFEDAPEDIGDDITDLKQVNFYVGNCSERKADVNVCFGAQNSIGENKCNVNVEYSQGRVKKGRDILYFETNALMYAAIFSEKDFYECQIQRLMMRTRNLAIIYADKADFISRVNCNTNLNSELLLLENSADNLKSSSELSSIASLVEEIEDKNIGECRLW